MVGGHAWQGACVPGGVHGRGGGVCMAGGHAWLGMCLAGGGAACVTGETATAADGMHPTGMHSCSVMLSHSDLINGFR